MKVRNYIAGEWRDSTAGSWQDAHNPATGEVIASVPLSSPEEVDQTARAAAAAYAEWRRIPAPTRVQYLFKLKNLMEEQFEALARSVTIENGKTLDDARGEMRRAIENVE